MHPVRKQRLIMVIFIVVFASVAVGLMAYALRENINLFYPPAKIVSGEAPVDKRIRAGGCVLPGQVKRASDSLDVSFLITDGAANVEVHFTGILPDLFAEGEAVVVNGRLNGDGVFMATEVLAKHDENYTPPEVAESMQGTDEHQNTCEGMSYGA
ncbi:cytochrome c maturation protein CcmE [Pseudomaricurvus alkylphenolicus]|uniref:cytochrome c maturation protein CcmE n=1 Tax=Pseudomaricurvus alkylphenolicus TaxID=1306991 RepID=UPI0014242235|nr:cytochrome c maturation protein CcmE [Pseudomaricurvus alkylphenolicus]NIB44521.1 cytochrome c maturation protein CcmE [Pseudomaricurvus alkylphenolicus]